MKGIEFILAKGIEAKVYKKVMVEILKEEADKLYGISQQDDNWGALAHRVVGAKE